MLSLDPNIITWIWFIAGIIMLLSEFIVPGLVVMFFGSGAILVAIARWVGIIESWQMSFGLWIASSLIFVVGLRKLIMKYFPSDTSYQSIEEDIDAYGKIVDVIEPINDQEASGRIRYQGSSWPAMTHKGAIEKGKKAKLLLRNNLAWIVEAYDDDEL